MPGPDPLPARESDEPFPASLRTLMAATGLSFRALGDATGRFREKAYSKGFMWQLASGKTKPTPENLEIIARAAGVRPAYFKEWREHYAAEEAKRIMRLVGLDATLEKLRELERG